MNPFWWASPTRTRRGRSSSTRNDGADGVGSPGAGMTGSGKRAHNADRCAASMMTSKAATISPQPMVNIGSCQSNSAPAANGHSGTDHRRRGEEADDPLALGGGNHQHDQRPRGDAGGGEQQLRRPEPSGHLQRQHRGDRHQRGDRQRVGGARRSRADQQTRHGDERPRWRRRRAVRSARRWPPGR